jgi:hypothetical protein
MLTGIPAMGSGADKSECIPARWKDPRCIIARGEEPHRRCVQHRSTAVHPRARGGTHLDRPLAQQREGASSRAGRNPQETHGEHPEGASACPKRNRKGASGQACREGHPRARWNLLLQHANDGASPRGKEPNSLIGPKQRPQVIDGCIWATARWHASARAITG